MKKKKSWTEESAPKPAFTKPSKAPEDRAKLIKQYVYGARMMQLRKVSVATRRMMLLRMLLPSDTGTEERK